MRNLSNSEMQGWLKQKGVKGGSLASPALPWVVQPYLVPCTRQTSGGSGRRACGRDQIDARSRKCRLSCTGLAASTCTRSCGSFVAWALHCAPCRHQLPATMSFKGSGLGNRNKAGARFGAQPSRKAVTRRRGSSGGLAAAARVSCDLCSRLIYVQLRAGVRGRLRDLRLHVASRLRPCACPPAVHPWRTGATPGRARNQR